MRYQTIPQTTSRSLTRAAHSTKPANWLQWVVQGLLALLFLFAGGAKLMMPVQILSAQSGLPGVFMRFIAVAEVFGALGLILPGLLKLRSELTTLAASGLVLIMIGAIIVTIMRQGVAPAIFPCVVGSLLALVIRANWRRGPLPYSKQAGRILQS